MKQYYLNEENALFRERADFVERFVSGENKWEAASWNAEQWLRENLVRELSEEQAREEMRRRILGSLDRKRLSGYLDLLCRERKIAWEPMKRQDACYVLGYPHYPEGMFNLLMILGPDDEYRSNLEAFPRGLLPTDMDLWQIRTALTYISRAERFCTGAIARWVENGILLKLLLRLEDLLDEFEGKKQHW